MPFWNDIFLRCGKAAMASAALALSLPALAAEAPTHHTVEIARMRYGTIPPSMKVGDSIIWDNRDTVPHTATARDRSFDVRIPAGKKVRLILTKAGTFAFYCIPHPMMRGALSITAK